MKVLILVFITSVAPVCLAQYEQFPDVPENHWVYETLVKLHSERIIDSPLAAFFRGGRPPDRMAVATWAQHACSAMLTRLESAEFAQRREDGIGGAMAQASALDKLAKETDNLAKMAFLFEPELKKRHVDAMSLREDMLSFPKRVKRILARTQRPAPFEPPAQDSALMEQFPDTPENHWVYQTLLNLRASNIIEVPDGFFRGSRPASTFEVADVAFDACVILRHRFAFLGSATLKQMKLLRQDIANLAKMADKFAAQYKWMLVDHVALKKEMETISEYIERARSNEATRRPPAAVPPRIPQSHSGPPARSFSCVAPSEGATYKRAGSRGPMIAKIMPN